MPLLGREQRRVVGGVPLSWETPRLDCVSEDHRRSVDGLVGKAIGIPQVHEVMPPKVANCDVDFVVFELRE